jgi:hypothetical protein
MARFTVADGLMLDASPQPGPIVAERTGAIRYRRQSLDPASLDHSSRRALIAYRASAYIDPRQRLMLALPTTSGPPAWADVGVMPPVSEAREATVLAGRLRSEGWLHPEVAGRVAFSLPRDPSRQVDALRGAQRQGATAFALCPETPPLPPSAALSAAFSAATYPYKP